ncbi:hypothetical protein THAOC_06521 [Thalassiosira oceanica]|uniref:Sugar transporter SWEET1 n=1 Tax=Thalassiosira oceanica TaxID=159749 RepID=K0T4A2_THAOC|nr:hypothetical protein THAOC_06521 [Thalassiosira oceanica]|eukprot:EJK71989.1 hypothetical protein THAOC_06521 [Thalassiosira oceanica]
MGVILAAAESGGGGGLEMTIDLDSPIVKSLIPKLGVVTSTALYFSPLMAVLNAKMSGDIGDLNPIPLTIMAISSVCWLAYGLSIQDPYVTISNVPGAVATIWYIVGVLSPWSCRLWTLLIRASLVITGFDTASAGEQSTGDCAEDTCDIVSGDDQPLDISLVDQKTFGRDPTLKVFSTRSSKSILAPLTAAQVGNTALWSAYGLAIKDRFVYGPNLAGLCFGLIQLFLKVLFPS